MIPRSRRLPFPAFLFIAFALAGLGLSVSGCSREPAEKAGPKAVAAAAPAAPSSFPSTDCRACHQNAYAAWAGSHHAFAHRPVDAGKDADALTPAKTVSVHGVDYDIDWKDGRPVFTEKRSDRPPQPYTADFVLGFTPLRQYIVPVGGGRYQAAELAFDPAKKDWFNVFGDERRQPGEWGHWRGRGMNWNSMCAHCHMTDFQKNYDAVADTYATTWREHGVGCSQCHAGIGTDHLDPKRTPSGGNTPPPNYSAADLKRAAETCAPCHARNELLTGRLHPGGGYNDYYRLTLPTEAAVFYPDGQVRDEDFNYTSLLTSRMGGKAGVTCLDCHDPHSGKTKLSVTDNSLCMQCHGPSPRLNAPVIDPLAHSRHQAGSTGNQCVTCHMPTTTYMQRDPRHDHGFLKPDPLLTKEMGIPNACNRCHADKDVDWAISYVDQWYGRKMESRQRARTRVVAAAQANAADAPERLLAMIADEDVPAWKATLLLLARNFAATHPRIIEAARAATRDPDAMVRSAAAQVLSAVPGEVANLRPLLSDPARLVRLDAAWPLSAELPAGSPIRRELDEYLAASADQPAGRLRIGQDLFNRGRAAEAEGALRKAAEWDPNSPGIQDTLGIILNELGKTDEAATALWRAARLNPTDATAAFNAALAFAGARKLNDAEYALREAVKRNPRLDRAWYNLGLLLVQTGRPADALAALQQAEQIAPGVADYPYARATVLWQTNQREAALAAARRTLEIDPNHAQARGLLQQR